MTDLLTAAELDALIPTIPAGIDRAALIAGAQQAIEALAGPLGAIVETRDGGSSVLLLARRAASITSIREAGDDDDLDPLDYWIRSDRRSIDRLATGPNPRRLWNGPVVVTYPAADDAALRRVVAIKLIQLDLAMTPGVLGFTEGNWSIQFPNGETWGATRDDILAAVGPLWHFG